MSTCSLLSPADSRISVKARCALIRTCTFPSFTNLGFLSTLQLKTYQEDFEAERRDRERMSEEKQSASLRYEAEITSLRLQLDRCRNELAHYTMEATRLSQQLRLKNQYEEEQYKKHLESRVSVVDVCVRACVHTGFCWGGGGGGGRAERNV